MVQGFAKAADWFSEGSPIQPSSVDLHVGEIFLPLVGQASCKDVAGLQEHILEPGETAVVTTSEMLKLPSQIGAFGFPPTRVSGKAVLMTNPGHVDPGFHGRMRFTLINMGREPFQIRYGDPIVTLLFLKTSSTPTADYLKRNPRVPHADGPSVDSLHRLGKDFLDFTRRAEAIAQAVVDKAKVKTESAERGLRLWLGGITLVITLGAVAAQCYGPVKDLQDLKARVTAMQGQLSVTAAQQRIDSLKARLDKLCRAVPKC